MASPVRLSAKSHILTFRSFCLRKKKKKCALRIIWGNVVFVRKESRGITDKSRILIYIRKERRLSLTNWAA